MRFLSIIGKHKVAEPTFDQELLHLGMEERSLLQSLNDEQLRIFAKWNDNRKKIRNGGRLKKLREALSTRRRKF